MSLRTQLRIQKPQPIQLTLLNLILMSFHLAHIPINAQKPTLEELSRGCIQPKRDTARERLRILCKRRKGVHDCATIVSGNDAGMEGEDAEIGVLWGTLGQSLSKM